MPAWSSLANLIARVKLARPRYSGGTQVLWSAEALRYAREAVDSPRPKLEPYTLLADLWHEHATAFTADYGSYARHLVSSMRVPGRAALDLACGTGLVTSALAGTFETVVGVDLSSAMLAQARARLAPFSNVELVQGDFREFTTSVRFDLITCAGDSVNYAATTDELRAVFRCVRRALAEGGVFVFDVQAVPFVSEAVIRHHGQGVPWAQVFAYDEASRVDTSFAILPTGVESHRRRLHAPDEIHSAARDAGLVAGDRFDGPLFRYLSSRAGRAFYSFTT